MAQVSKTINPTTTSLTHFPGPTSQPCQATAKLGGPRPAQGAGTGAALHQNQLNFRKEDAQGLKEVRARMSHTQQFPRKLHTHTQTASESHKSRPASQPTPHLLNSQVHRAHTAPSACTQCVHGCSRRLVRCALGDLIPQKAAGNPDSTVTGQARHLRASETTCNRNPS